MDLLPLWDRHCAGRILKGECLLFNLNLSILTTIWAIGDQNTPRCIENLEHACSCKATACSLSICEKMRRVVGHYRVCKQKDSGSCGVCKQLLALCCYHAKLCQVRISNIYPSCDPRPDYNSQALSSKNID